MDGVVGVTAKLTSTAGVTVTVVVPCMAPKAAVITDVPGATECTKPPVFTVAVAGVPEDHVADAVTFWTELSEYFAVAVSC